MNDEIELADYDFGFTTHSEENINTAEVIAAQTKAEMMYQAIMPLLKNLKMDSDKNAYIHWPNRAEKIDQFISRLDKIINS